MATAERERIRLSLDVSPELYQLLESIAQRTDESKSDVLRKAIVLMDIAVKASQDGKRLLVEEPVLQGERAVTEIVGLFPPKPINEGRDKDTSLFDPEYIQDPEEIIDAASRRSRG